jgi:beta-glucosidase
MNKLIFYFFILVSSFHYSCSPKNKPAYKDPSLSAEKRADDLISRMTLDEKVAQTFCLSADQFLRNGEIDSVMLTNVLKNGFGQIRDCWSTSEKNTVKINNRIQKYLSENTRLGIPVIIHGEGLHGFVGDHATSFPQAIALSGTWNLELIDKVYSITANEARSRGIQHLLSPVLDVARDPRWGRFSETFGEDPYLTGEIGVQVMKSYQGDNQDVNNPHHVMATLKHFPGSGTTVGGLNVAPMVTGERDFREIFLYPFKQAVQRGNAMSVMAFYGEYDGIPTHTNTHLLRDILRTEWGFKGIVVSDYFALELLQQGWIWEYYKHQVAKDSVEAAQMAITAGVNIDMVNSDSYYALKDLVLRGKVPESVLDGIVRETLICKFKLGLFDHYLANSDTAIAISNDPNSKAIALEAACQSLILLKNENNLLPINPARFKKIAVIGPNAKDTILGDYSTKKPLYFVSVYEGIKNRAGAQYEILYARGCNITPGTPEFTNQLLSDRKLVSEAIAIAKKADVIVLAVGGNVETDREGRDRSDLQMLGLQNELIAEVCKLGKPVILSLFGGKLYAIPETYKKVDATLLCWTLGQETGNGFASVLFGDTNPAGKLTVSIPVSTGHLPCYYNKKPSAFGRSYYYEDYVGGSVYPFGFGLSYTTFEIKNVRMQRETIATTDTVNVFAEITNTGKIDGAEVTQLYIRDVISSVTRPMKQLKDFQRVYLKAGETKQLIFRLTPEKLSFYDRDMKSIVEPGEFEVMVGNSSMDKDLRKVRFSVK